MSSKLNAPLAFHFKIKKASSTNAVTTQIFTTFKTEMNACAIYTSH